MSKIFFTSDFHFCHNKEFIYQSRGFSSVDEMNTAIIQNFQKTLNWDDELYILGDIMLNDNQKGLHAFQQIPGIKHIILGNHDTDTRIGLYKSCVDVGEVVAGKFFKYKSYHFFLSHYPCLCSNLDDINKPLKYKVINLCGHTHTQDKFSDMSKGLIYHVEVDAHNCYPIEITDIINDIKQRR